MFDLKCTVYVKGKGYPSPIPCPAFWGHYHNVSWRERRHTPAILAGSPDPGSPSGLRDAPRRRQRGGQLPPASDGSPGRGGTSGPPPAGRLVSLWLRSPGPRLQALCRDRDAGPIRRDWSRGPRRSHVVLRLGEAVQGICSGLRQAPRRPAPPLRPVPTHSPLATATPRVRARVSARPWLPRPAPQIALRPACGAEPVRSRMTGCRTGSQAVGLEV